MLKASVVAVLPKQKVIPKQGTPHITPIIQHPNPLMEVGLFDQVSGNVPQIPIMINQTRKINEGTENDEQYQATTAKGARGIVTTQDYYIGEGSYYD
jgi:hypothetical protein